MHPNRCAACCGHLRVSRRGFLGVSALAVGVPLLGRCGGLLAAEPGGRVRPNGPAAQCVPSLKVAFVRRKEPYGMSWPGAVYDGQAAHKLYLGKIQETAGKLNVKLDIRPEPIYSDEEADAWIAQVKEGKPDGLLIVMLDRQRHCWPTATKATDIGIPTVIYSPIGTSMTPNTIPLARKNGCIVYSTDDFSQAAYGMKMLWAGTKMRATRYLVIHGAKEFDSELADLGIQLRHLPAAKFLEAFRATPETPEMVAMAEDYIKRAQQLKDANRQDVINGAKFYFLVRKLLDQYECDAVTMDCLGVLGPTEDSLPCLAWSRLNDEAVPAACEADLGAAATMLVVHYLFDRPGFQQDPVAETARRAIIGSHCSCPTRLAGFDQPPEPFVVRHHHANRDATTQTLWREGQAVTCADILPGAAPPKAPGAPPRSVMLISSGRVLGNVSVPPAGGCVCAVMVQFDGVDTVEKVLAYPGFHQMFFYGEFKQQLVDFCRLYNLEPQVV